MAATIQLNINTNAPQVQQQITMLQQMLNQLARRYNVVINAQISSSLTNQLNTIINLLGQISGNQNIGINVQMIGGNNILNQLRQLDNSLQNISNTGNTVGNSFNTVTMNIRNYDRQQQDTTIHNNILVGALRTLGHVLVHEVRNAFNQAFTEMKNVDTELITIQKVTGATAEEMKKYADDAYEVAARLGATASEYLNAVAEFAKAGYQEQSKELGELAITAAKVGDTTQSVANQFLLSVDAAYKYNGSIEKLTAVLDGANEIGNNYATSVEKMAEGLGKVSPIAAQAHVGIDELTAAIGTITAVTQRSGQEAATALRALFLNIIGDTKTEIEDGAKWTAGEIEGLRDLLREYAPEAVKAADATGKVINPMEAIAALSQAMKDGLLTEQKLMEQITDIGGKLRSSQLLALVQNFDKYQDMLETYRTAAGSAAEEYAIYLNSWEAKTKQLSATWTDFVQNQLGTDEIKGLLDFLIKIVENLDNIVPLIVSIGVGIVGMNLPGLVERLGTLLVTLNSVQGAIGLVAVAIGFLISENRKYVNDLKKAATESAKEADKIKETANKYLELSAQIESAKDGSEEYISVSERIRAELGDQAGAVENLAEKWRETTRAMLENEQQAANTALTGAEAALVADYNSIRFKPITIGASQFKSYGESTPEWMSKAHSMFAGSSAVSFNSWTNRYGAANTQSASGIAAYYTTMGDVLSYLNQEMGTLRKNGDEAAASEIFNSELYQTITTAFNEMGGSLDTYNSAVERVANADATLAGFDKFRELSKQLDPEIIKTTDDYKEFLKAVEESNELTEEQKKILTELAKETFPDLAESVDETRKKIEQAKSALEAFQEATKKGKEKDDPFKEYKSAFDAVMKAGAKGAFGSNAFQYGVQALVDPATIERFKGDWKGLYNFIKTTQTAIYKDADSMGTGMLERIQKVGEQTKKGFYELKDASGEVVATFDKKSGDWWIDESNLAGVADALGMSAESIVANAQALSALDPDANVQPLVDALAELNEQKKEVGEEQPDITVMTNSEEAISQITSVGDAVNALPSEKSININIVTTGSLPWVKKNAKGDKNYQGGPTLVNDEPGGYNPELIVANGRAFIANGGNPAVLDLPKGATIYNASETRDIFFGSGGDLVNFPSFAGGNAGSYKWSTNGKKKVSGGSGGDITAAGAAAFSDDMLDKLDTYMKEILDAAEEALDDQLEAINAQIYALKYQTEAAEKATALEEARLNLLEAEKNLLDANTERTVRYYNAATGQWEWMADKRAVAKAQEDLYDAQKKLLQEQYKALEDAWGDIKEYIKKMMENSEEIDIEAVLAALSNSNAADSVEDLRNLIASIFGFTENPKAGENFDGGGIARGLGWMPKGTAGAEAVLDPSVTSAILNPQTNAAFTGFTDSLKSLFGMAGGGGTAPSSRFAGNVSNLYGGNTYIEGVRIGSDMMSRPLSEVLSTLNLYRNN